MCCFAILEHTFFHSESSYFKMPNSTVSLFDKWSCRQVNSRWFYERLDLCVCVKEFEAAAEKVKKLKEKPTDQELLGKLI